MTPIPYVRNCGYADRRQSKWDAENLHRHVDYAPTPAPAPAGKENMQLEDDVKVNGDSSHSTFPG